MEGTRSFTSIDLSLDDMKALTGIKGINPAFLYDQNARENIISGYYKLIDNSYKLEKEKFQSTY